ncbi:MAG: 5-oxoprolinase subunit PxpA [Phaeodactylibacter sp.]|uniref:5-oxoprolinase subunit PxpA n=1 Tax=Phaeodactylibacter sp. TaxID=1940289 RepID=UPI0032EED906
MQQSIDINADLGESTQTRRFEHEDHLFPYLSSCNIACGFHGGDPVFIEAAIRQALKHRLQIGAHPSYPDRLNFGRQPMNLPSTELQAVLRYQVSALKGMVESLGGQLSYIKPHGALYHTLCQHEAQAQLAVAVFTAIDPNLKIMGLPGSALARAAGKAGLYFIREGFADRRYGPEGQLLPRNMPGAVLKDPAKVVEQARQILMESSVTTSAGTRLPLQVDSLCIHGDNPMAVPALKALDHFFAQSGIQKSSV